MATMRKPGVKVTCDFCSEFQTSIKRMEGGKLRFCPRIEQDISPNHIACDKFVAADYFWCPQNQRLHMSVCKNRRKNHECPRSCEEAKVVDAVTEKTRVQQSATTFKRRISQ